MYSTVGIIIIRQDKIGVIFLVEGGKQQYCSIPVLLKLYHVNN